MSNVTAGKKYTQQLAESCNKLTNERDTLRTRASTAEEKGKDLEAKLDKSSDQNTALKAATDTLDQAGKRMDIWMASMMTEKRDLQTAPHSECSRHLF